MAWSEATVLSKEQGLWGATNDRVQGAPWLMSLRFRLSRSLNNVPFVGDIFSELVEDEH